MVAAVSDFYIPTDKMVDHKIQSKDLDMLELTLHPVPKKLGLIKSEWCPTTTLISFKVKFCNHVRCSLKLTLRYQKGNAKLLLKIMEWIWLSEMN